MISDLKSFINTVAVAAVGNYQLQQIQLQKQHGKHNGNERKSEQAHIPQVPTVYNEWQFQALVRGNRTENQFQISKFKKGVTPREKK